MRRKKKNQRYIHVLKILNTGIIGVESATFESPTKVVIASNPVFVIERECTYDRNAGTRVCSINDEKNIDSETLAKILRIEIFINSKIIPRSRSSARPKRSLARDNYFHFQNLIRFSPPHRYEIFLFTVNRISCTSINVAAIFDKFFLLYSRIASSRMLTARC